MTDRLKEAGKLGLWLESRLHLALTEIADDLLGDGFITREERIVLSGAIGSALTTYNEEIMANAPQLYARDRWEMGEASTTLVGDLVPLEEAVKPDGTMPIIKLIKPGWGSSGYYSADVLKRDGPQVFTPGVKMYWDHPTESEESERPERSLRDLAAELVSGAEYQETGPRGPGLYARAKVFGPYREAINELGPHIGVSIRALGRARHGEADGRQGPIIEQIVTGKSVDFVTVAGAGGEIVGLFEAARGAPRITQESQEVAMADVDLQTMQAENESLRESVARLTELLMFREAGDVVTEVLQTVEMPDATRARLSRDLARKPVVVEGKLDRDAFKAVILEAAKGEMEYLAQAGMGSSPVHGMGASGTTGTAQGQANLAAAMQRLGLSEAGAKIAAQGR